MTYTDFMSYLGVGSSLIGTYLIGTGSIANGSGLVATGSTLLAAWAVRVDAAGLFILFAVTAGIHAIGILALRAGMGEAE